MMGQGFGYGSYGMGGGSGMMFFGILIIGLIIYFLLKGQNVNGYVASQTASSTEALEIAKSRLAKGEITTEEFETIKENLL
ncbi:SHOCT domain-containing protein [Tepidibacillus sp. LV47]|uniref:SHOCT domain-containing protein n=1 Tax=Tepidibacillus sp. LV47 TaxID=3398228 RepID=UPI003AB1021B